ncbi:ABC transporter substrate-binding protein [Pseudochelatococcus sp. B33]
MPRLDILNWQSRRAIEPVARAIALFRQSRPDCEIVQTVRPLSDFEHQDIEVVAKRHDIVVFDHPFCGAIAASGCFLPLEDLMPDVAGPGMDGRYIGPSLSTYRFAGHVWGAPIDGATQHAIYRPDLLQKLGGGLPVSHADVLGLGRRARDAGLYLGTAIETPHALLSIFSYMANRGEPVVADDHGLRDIPAASFAFAYDAVRAVMDLSPEEAKGWNSIDLHEAMATRDDVVYAPVVYGYATYGEPDLPNRLGFAPFAGGTAPHDAGTTIGGTAMGLSRFSASREAAAAFVRFMAGAEVQRRVVAENNGQPASLAGWQEADIDARFNGFFSSVRGTVERAWTRPRFNGYAAFQRRGGGIVADALRHGADAETARRRLLELDGAD